MSIDNNRADFEYFNYSTHKPRLSSLAGMYDLKPLVYNATFFRPVHLPRASREKIMFSRDGLDWYHRKLHLQVNIAIRHIARIFIDAAVIIVVENICLFRNKWEGNFQPHVTDYRTLHKLTLLTIIWTLSHWYLWTKHIEFMQILFAYILYSFRNQYSFL